MSSSPAPTLFLNLPATSVPSATAFYTAVGLTPVPAWSDGKTAAFMLPAPNASVCLMVHEHARFKTFIRPGAAVADARAATETLFSVTCESKEEVDAWLDKAEKAGGKKDPYVLDGYGEAMGMYSRSFEDVDGHIWEVLVMTGTCGAKPEEKAEEKAERKAEA